MMTPWLAWVVPVAMQASPGVPPAPTTNTTTTTTTAAAPNAGVVTTTTTTQESTSPGVLTLNEAVLNAEKHQPQLRQAQAATEVAAARIDQARSGYLPQLIGTASYTRETGNFAIRPGATAAPTAATSWSLTQSFNYWSFGLQASQLIYDFGQTSERWHAAEANTDAAKANEKVTEYNLLLNVRKAYFAARAQKALAKVADETLANQVKHLNQTEGFVRVGTQPEIALAQARTDMANARVALINAQNAYDSAKALLNQAMGVVGGADYDVAEDAFPPVEGEDLPSDQLARQALSSRPEIAALDKQREAQEMTIRSVKGAYGPSLAAVGSATEQGVALDGLVPNWAVGATLTWPIFQGGLTNGLVREAEATLGSVNAQTDVARLQVRLDVEQARLAVRAAKASIAAVRDALVNARQQLRLAEGRYQSGVGNIIEQGDAQVAVTNAAAQVVQADYNLSSARAQLLTALGRR